MIALCALVSGPSKHQVMRVGLLQAMPRRSDRGFAVFIVGADSRTTGALAHALAQKLHSLRPQRRVVLLGDHMQRTDDPALRVAFPLLTGELGPSVRDRIHVLERLGWIASAIVAARGVVVAQSSDVLDAGLRATRAAVAEGMGQRGASMAAVARRTHLCVCVCVCVCVRVSQVACLCWCWCMTEPNLRHKGWFKTVRDCYCSGAAAAIRALDDRVILTVPCPSSDTDTGRVREYPHKVELEIDSSKWDVWQSMGIITTFLTYRGYLEEVCRERKHARAHALADAVVLVCRGVLRGCLLSR